MNLTQILYSGLGGHGNVAFSLIEAEKNHLNNALIFFGIEETKPEYISRSKDLQIPFREIIKKKGADFKSFYLSYKYLKQLKTDVILLHSITLIIPAIIYCLLHRKKLVVVEHNANEIKRRSEWVWSKMALLFANKVVYLSNKYKLEVKEKVKSLFRERKTVVIPNGLDLNKFSPTTDFGNSKELKLGMVSRINPYRDHKTLIKAFEIVHNAMPERSLQLHIAGDGNSLQELQSLIVELGLTDKVIFTGMLNENQIVEFLSKLDIYCHSTFAETMSTSIMQALATGLPILCSDIEGVKNLMVNNYNCLLAEVSNATNWAEKMTLLIENSKKRAELTKNSLNFAKENLSNEVMFQKYLQVFNSESPI